MKEYTGILQIEFGFSAKNDDDAQERAETIADILSGNYVPTNKWMPDSVDVTQVSVQES